MKSRFCPRKVAKKHVDYQGLFQESFWPVIDKDLNGTCHCQYDYTGERVTPKGMHSCIDIFDN